MGRRTVLVKLDRGERKFLSAGQSTNRKKTVRDSNATRERRVNREEQLINSPRTDQETLLGTSERRRGLRRRKQKGGGGCRGQVEDSPGEGKQEGTPPFQKPGRKRAWGSGSVGINEHADVSEEKEERSTRRVADRNGRIRQKDPR